VPIACEAIKKDPELSKLAQDMATLLEGRSKEIKTGPVLLKPGWWPRNWPFPPVPWPWPSPSPPWIFVIYVMNAKGISGSAIDQQWGLRPGERQKLLESNPEKAAEIVVDVYKKVARDIAVEKTADLHEFTTQTWPVVVQKTSIQPGFEQKYQDLQNLIDKDAQDIARKCGCGQTCKDVAAVLMAIATIVIICI
ncbi:MAG: hypothetical protein MUO97_05035, partial [Dehalococcoidia bacterium]|nr:hypothetical protein [Dehalococcoidia bacterium]